MPHKNGNDHGRIIHMPDLDFTPNPRGLGCAIYDAMLVNKDKIAQIDYFTGEEDTYGSVLQRCIRTAQVMRKKGVTSQDVVTVLTLNHLNSVVPYIAALFLGARVSALDPLMTLDEAKYLLKQVSPKMVFVVPEAVKLVEDALKSISRQAEIVVFGKSEQHVPFRDFLDVEVDKSFVPVSAESPFDTAMIFFSSGTTGFPKGICINHFTLLSQIENGIRCGFCFDVNLVATSLYWTTSVYFLGTAIFTGSTRIVVPRFNVEIMWNSIHKYKPTSMVTSPRQLAEMLQHRPKNIDTGSLKHILVGGAPLLEKNVLNIRRNFPDAKLCPGYGQTETTLFITSSKPAIAEQYELLVQRPTTCGTPMPGISYKVVDPDTEELLGPYEWGELRLKTKFVLNGYHNQDSSEVWDADGWYRTGDLVYYDEHNFFYIVDRIKELLKFRDWHVQPAVLEALLDQHPAVSNAVVVGIPHEEDGELPMAIVEVNEGCKFEVTAEDIASFVNERCNDLMRLRAGVKIVDRIPSTPTGKVRRRDLRDMVLRGEI